MNRFNLDPEELELLQELEREEWQSVVGQPEDLEPFRQAALSTVRKDKCVNIRLSERDLRSLQKIAAEEGIPYQTLLSSIIHKFVSEKTEA